MALDPAFESAIRSRASSSAFSQWMGFRLLDIDDGLSRVAIDLEPHHLNPGGIAHGGVIATILDGAIGLALRTKIGDRGHVTVQLDIHYISPVSSGTLIAQGRAVHSGSRVGYGEAEVFADDGRLIAKGAATFLVVERAEPVPAGD
jgi:uncharacterized protein (TIGR00369 family)